MPEIVPGVSLELAQQRADLLRKVHYRLHLNIPETVSAPVQGRNAVSFDLLQVPQALQLDFQGSSEQITALRINGQDADIRYEAEHLVVPGSRLRAGRNEMVIDFIAGRSALNRKPEFLYTLFVPDRARTVFPLFDQPDIKARWQLSLEVPAHWTALSISPRAGSQVEGARKSVSFEASDRVSSYLFSFVAGEFEVVSKEVNGREIRLLHREPDAAKVTRNLNDIFRLHGDAIAWLEEYTGIPLPFKKFDIALIPAHPYGGMEHVGAIQYRAESLWLEEAPSDTELLNRASLIAHETAHMWFGNLVTMRWFNDVWTKEVFANFMAAKIVNPEFPDIDHDLKFLARHYPRAYAIDRTSGANAIRQPLANLNQAGQLYGSIIYNKAPIMLRQLEARLGEAGFRQGVRTYLSRFAHGNATWPELLEIFDPDASKGLKPWSKVWVNGTGRPVFTLRSTAKGLVVSQTDPAQRARVWPQQFSYLSVDGEEASASNIGIGGSDLTLSLSNVSTSAVLLNANGYGYGVFPAAETLLSAWDVLSDVNRGSLLIQLYESMLENGRPYPAHYLSALLSVIERERNQVLLELATAQLRHIFWNLLAEPIRESVAPPVEATLWAVIAGIDAPALRRLLFFVVADISLTEQSLQRIEDIWNQDERSEDVPLSERDLSAIAMTLSIKRPETSGRYLESHMRRIQNPDERRRLEFLAPSVSEDRLVRDAFFASLASVENRSTESWVLDALHNLHHPLRVSSSEKYVLPALELLEDIQATGDIFFPAGWTQATLRNHYSASVIAIVQDFLAQRPAFNPQLRLKILQALDPALRAHRLRQLSEP
ncbi:MAG: M1 family aminopeptidase [Pseudomonadota bacterium]